MNITSYFSNQLFQGKTVFITDGGQNLAGSALFNLGAAKMMKAHAADKK